MKFNLFFILFILSSMGLFCLGCAQEKEKPEETPVGEDADVLFNRNEIHQLKLTLPEAAWEKLVKNAVDEVYTPADITLMGQTVKNVGLRFKGSYGSLFNCFDDNGQQICDKLSMKVKFSEYDKEQRFLGLKRLNIHAMRNDPTKIHERIAYQLYRQMEIPAPRTSYAQVWVNDELLGLFALVEQIDGRFTDDRFTEGDGNLYKEAWPDNADPERYDDAIKTNKETATHEVFARFAEEILTASQEDLPTILARWMDLDYLMRYMAVDHAIGNWDGWTTFYAGDGWCQNHNYYMYQSESRDFFWIIPWDMDATFFTDHWLGERVEWYDTDAGCDPIPIPETDMDTVPAACDPLFKALLREPEGRLKREIDHLRQHYFNREALMADMAEAEQLLSDAVAADPDLSLDEWRGALDWMEDEIDLLIDRLDELENIFNAAAGITM